MLSISRKTPEIVITGSTGKTTTKEMLASILETKWNILQTTGNKNLPLHIKSTLKLRKPVHRAVLLELGMGRPGAGHRHGRYIQPDIVVFTNIGSAHYGSLGNSVRSIAENKSTLIQYMNKDGLILLNSDDKNSEYIDVSAHHGKVITIGINKQADYTASEVRYEKDGMIFTVDLGTSRSTFFIPAFGLHNVYNALFAITIAHQLGFTIPEITQGLKKFEPPVKRLNIIKLRSEMLLIDDTVNANPESVKSAIDVLAHLGKDKKKIVVLGSMLELGEYTKEAHIEIGRYVANNGISDIYTYGVETISIKEGAIESGFSADRIHYFESREMLHEVLLNKVADNSVILVKGSASMKMSSTVNFFKSWFRCFIHLADHLEHDEARIHPRMFERLDNIHSCLTLHFGQYSATLRLREDAEIPEDVLLISRKCWSEFTIPDLPYDHYFIEDHLHLGPVIGFNVFEKYYDQPDLQLLRMANYDQIKGLLFMFRASQNKLQSNIITGKYYDPRKHAFIEGIFPYPSAIFNRVPLLPGVSKRLMRHIGNNVFNHPYGNTDKWKFYQACSQIPDIRKNLPKTVKYTGLSSLFKMIDVYNCVYLKPCTLAGGAGIFAIWVVNGGYRLKNERGEEWTVDSGRKLGLLVEKQLMSKRTYIIQEGIASEFDIGKVDFRIYIQKNRTGTWKFTGLEAKIGMKGSIIANSKYRQKIMPGKTVLEELYLLKDEQVTNMISEMSSSVIRLLNELERSHKLLGDAAIDLIVDKSLNIRILEVQFNYAAEIKQYRTEDESEVLPNIVSTPWEYAKYLAGFTPYVGESEL